MRILIGLLAFTYALSAETSPVRAHGFYAPSAFAGNGSTFAQGVGFGVEGLVYKGLGVGADLGWFWPRSSFREGIGALSANPSYHFRLANGRVEPFVTGGYGLLFRSSAENAFNFGGGATVWFGQRTGLRLEVRDHVVTRYSDLHLVSFRIGFAFR